MEINLSVTISLISLSVSAATAYYAHRQIVSAAAALMQQNDLRLFEAFSECSDILVNNPSLLQSVHGIPNERCTDEEGKAIAYLCSLIDAFQIYYEKRYSGDFSKMECELLAKSNFLTKTITIPGNSDRLNIIKEYFYGDFDNQYFAALERVVEHYKRAKNNSA
ncbi:MAG: hypothetical protein EOM56_13310 [Deltaproteobacteria bacterium]|nr:hypothetical protein [Deltaproteobacteria bacterium]